MFSVLVHFSPGFISFAIVLLFLSSPQPGEVCSATSMAALAPAEIYSLNLGLSGLSEIGNQINQIQQQLDKTEDLVNNLSEIKLNQETRVILQRQVGDGDLVTLGALPVIWPNIMKQYFRWSNLILMLNKYRIGMKVGGRRQYSDDINQDINSQLTWSSSPQSCWPLLARLSSVGFSSL